MKKSFPISKSLIYLIYTSVMVLVLLLPLSCPFFPEPSASVTLAFPSPDQPPGRAAGSPGVLAAVLDQMETLSVRVTSPDMNPVGPVEVSSDSGGVTFRVPAGSNRTFALAAVPSQKDFPETLSEFFPEKLALPEGTRIPFPPITRDVSAGDSIHLTIDLSQSNLILNPSFTAAAAGQPNEWSSSTSWQEVSGDSGTAPGVRDSTLYFSSTAATVSQSGLVPPPNPGWDGYLAWLIIRKDPEDPAEPSLDNHAGFSLTFTVPNADGLLASWPPNYEGGNMKNLTNAFSASWQAVPLGVHQSTLDSADLTWEASIADIESISVTVTGNDTADDGSGWAGNYGPQVAGLYLFPLRSP